MGTLRLRLTSEVTQSWSHNLLMVEMGFHPWELECQARTVNWWIILFPCGSCTGHLCILHKHRFFLPLLTSSEFSLGNHTHHSPPSPPQSTWFGQHWYALYSLHPMQGGQMIPLATVNTYDQRCPMRLSFLLTAEPSVFHSRLRASKSILVHHQTKFSSLVSLAVHPFRPRSLEGRDCLKAITVSQCPIPTMPDEYLLDEWNSNLIQWSFVEVGGILGPRSLNSPANPTLPSFSSTIFQGLIQSLTPLKLAPSLLPTPKMLSAPSGLPWFHAIYLPCAVN